MTNKLHGWRAGETYFLSLRPKEAKAAANAYATSQEALREASRRGLPIVWDDPATIE